MIQFSVLPYFSVRRLSLIERDSDEAASRVESSLIDACQPVGD
jgi:hypothetical protein